MTTATLENQNRRSSPICPCRPPQTLRPFDEDAGADTGRETANSDSPPRFPRSPARRWWGRNPVDLFFRSSPFDDGVAERAEMYPFATGQLPFLAANDLAVFKALFDQPKDWLDIAAMAGAGSVDLAAVADVLTSLVGDDARADRLRALG